jgi:hypothetical protein
MENVLIEIAGALVASVIGGIITGASMASRISTDILWLKKTTDRLEKQHDIMTAALSSLKLTAYGASNDAKQAAADAHRMAEEILNADHN